YIVREGKRIGPWEVPNTQPRSQGKVRRIAPEARAAALVPEEQSRLAELLQQLIQQPSTAEQPLSRSPWNDARYPERFGLSQQLANGTPVLESPGRAKNQHLEPLAARDLPTGDDEEVSLPARGEHAVI